LDSENSVQEIKFFYSKLVVKFTALHFSPSLRLLLVLLKNLHSRQKMRVHGMTVAALSSTSVAHMRIIVRSTRTQLYVTDMSEMHILFLQSFVIFNSIK